MGRDFPGRFGDSSENFSADLAGLEYSAYKPKADPELTAIWAGMRQVIERGANDWEVIRTIPDSPQQDATEDNPDLGCPEQVLATRKVAEEIARHCEITRVGFGVQAAGLAEITIGLARLYALLNDRIPHRKFTVAAVQDTQQQLGDGFNAVCQRIGQFIEARTGRRVKKLNFPSLGPTPNKFDANTDPGEVSLILKLVKEVLNLEE